MKTVCFLDRSELKDLIGWVSKVMPDGIHCPHLADNAPAAEKLAAKGISNVPVFAQNLPEALISACIGEDCA